MKTLSYNGKQFHVYAFEQWFRVISINLCLGTFYVRDTIAGDFEIYWQAVKKIKLI